MLVNDLLRTFTLTGQDMVMGVCALALAWVGCEVVTWLAD